MRYSVIVTRDVTMTQSCVVEVEASGADEAENKAIEASGTVHRGNGGSAIMTTETKHTPELAAAINALLDRPESNRHLINYLTQLEMQRSELAAALRKIALMDGYNELMEAISIAEAVLAKVSA